MRGSSTAAFWCVLPGRASTATSTRCCRCACAPAVAASAARCRGTDAGGDGAVSRDASPFKDMTIPDDVTVRTQVLAEPAPELAAKTWARLSDGTPLVTAERRNQGWVVLFHVTATPEWSSLPLSGLFIDLLRRMIDMSNGVAGDDDSAACGGLLPPLQVMDGLGHLVPPGPTAAPVAAQALIEGKAGPEMSPGLYTCHCRATRSHSTCRRNSPSIFRAPCATCHGGRDAHDILRRPRPRARRLKPWLLSAAPGVADLRS